MVAFIHAPPRWLPHCFQTVLGGTPLACLFGKGSTLALAPGSHPLGERRDPSQQNKYGAIQQHNGGRPSASGSIIRNELEAITGIPSIWTVQSVSSTLQAHAAYTAEWLACAALGSHCSEPLQQWHRNNNLQTRKNWKGGPPTHPPSPNLRQPSQQGHKPRTGPAPVTTAPPTRCAAALNLKKKL